MTEKNEKKEGSAPATAEAVFARKTGLDADTVVDTRNARLTPAVDFYFKANRCYYTGEGAAKMLAAFGLPADTLEPVAPPLAPPPAIPQPVANPDFEPQKIEKKEGGAPAAEDPQQEAASSPPSAPPADAAQSTPEPQQEAPSSPAGTVPLFVKRKAANNTSVIYATRDEAGEGTPILVRVRDNRTWRKGEQFQATPPPTQGANWSAIGRNCRSRRRRFAL